jgi:hypothetical protein
VETDACNFQHPPGAEARSFIASVSRSRPIGIAADLRFLHSTPREIRVLSAWRP